MIELAVIFGLAGIAAGFMAGLLGIGGGFVIVPVLVWVLPLANVPAEQVPHFAIGTSLLCISVTAIFSARAHHQKSAVDWQLFKLVSPGLIVGTIAGAAVASFISGTILIIFFVSGALLTGLYLLSNHQPKPSSAQSSWPFVWYAGFTGVVSALVGIGGGSVLVPYLVYKGKPIVKAVGTAAACGFPIALFGALGYGVFGLNAGLTVATLQTGHPSVEFSTGYLYWPAFLGVVVFSSLAAPLGAKLAHSLSPNRLRQAFAVFLFFTGGQILYSHWF